VAPDDIFQAIRAGDAARVRRLLADDTALASARNEDGVSAVLFARYRAQPEALDVLLEAEPELDEFEAAGLGRTARLAEILDRHPERANGWSADGFSPLHLAAFFGHLETVRLLLRRGAEVSAPAERSFEPGVTPLQSAIAGGHTEIALELMEGGADVRARTADGVTPLHAAAQRGDERVLEALLARGADPTVLDGRGRAAADLAEEAGHGAQAARLR
jgi:uncharacterized protein